MTVHEKPRPRENPREPKVHTSLAKHQARATTGDDQLQAMRRAAWHKQGVAMIRVDDLPNEFDRLAVEAIANGLFGRREKRTDGEVAE